MIITNTVTAQLVAMRKLRAKQLDDMILPLLVEAAAGREDDFSWQAPTEPSDYGVGEG